MSEAGQKIRYEKGAAIYLEAEPADHWYAIYEGMVRTCRYLPNGLRQVTGFFVGGEIFGVEAGRYSATAEAVTDVTVVRRPRRELETATPRDDASHPLNLALRKAEDRIHLLVRKGASARLAGFLLAIAVRDGHGGWFARLPMSRADIADYIAVDVATVSRLLSRLLKQRLLVPGPEASYRIEAAEALEALAEGEPWPGAGISNLEDERRSRRFRAVGVAGPAIGAGR